MSSEFEIATRLEKTKDGFAATVPDGWQQGKGAFGGVVVGLLARAIIGTEADKTRRVRSLAADLAAPLLPGAARVEVATLRRGVSMTFVDARIVQNGAIIARASASLAAARPVTGVAIRPVVPRREPWRDVPVLPVVPPLGPAFARKYEYRPTGHLPFSGGTEPTTAGWIREKTPPVGLDVPAIAGLLDAWWPTSFSIESAPRAVATVGYTMQILVDPSTLPTDEPLFYQARGVASFDNLFVEMRELWHGDRIVTMNQQTLAVLA